MLFNWFTHPEHHEKDFLNCIAHFRKIAKTEAKNMKSLHFKDGLRRLEELMKLVYYEEKEGVILEKQLVFQFKSHQAELMKKNQAMTLALGQRVTEINKLVNSDILQNFIGIEDSIKAGNIREAEQRRREVMQLLIALESELKLATELIIYIEKWQAIPSVVCTKTFIYRLKTKQMKSCLDEIEQVLSSMANQDWLKANSGSLEVSGGNIYSCPKKGGVNLRVIYTVEGSNLVVHDVMRHTEYEQTFSRKGKLNSDSGRFQVFRPLTAFALQSV